MIRLELKEDGFTVVADSKFLSRLPDGADTRFRRRPVMEDGYLVLAFNPENGKTFQELKDGPGFFLHYTRYRAPQFDELEDMFGLFSDVETSRGSVRVTEEGVRIKLEGLVDTDSEEVLDAKSEEEIETEDETPEMVSGSKVLNDWVEDGLDLLRSGVSPQVMRILLVGMLDVELLRRKKEED